MLVVKPIGEDVAGVVPAGVQPQRSQAHDVHLLAAAPLDAPCTGIRTSHL